LVYFNLLAAVQTINLFQAKTHLSKLIDQIASGEETEFIIARSGKPVARILPVAPPTRRAGSASLRASLSKGEFLGRRLPPDLSQETLVNFSCITL
jgi:antitoxin (DNA-binding transcriptional repressor) of toxin-antitoxin stability system